jgi:hypothetical protein
VDPSDARTLARLVLERGLLDPDDLAEAGAIGRYEVVRPLGAGASGQVFLAKDPLLDRPVAIKLTDRRVAEERVRQELRVLARLEHPGVVAIHDAGVHEGRLFLVMTYVEGPTLAASDLPLRAWVEVLARVLEACHDVHARGVVHRDLKPANILLGPDGPRIADFGVAKLLVDDGGEAKALTGVGQLLGTPAYMAPEQVGVGEVGPRTDVFAAGAMLYERLCGEPPFAGDGLSLLQVAVRLSSAAPPVAPSLRRPHLTGADVDAAGLERVALRALAHAPADRYPSAGAMAGELRRCLDARPGRAPGRGRLAALVLALVLAIALGTLLASLGRSAPAPAARTPPARPAVDAPAAPALGPVAASVASTAPTPAAPPPPTRPADAAARLEALPAPPFAALPAGLAEARALVAGAPDGPAAREVARAFTRWVVRLGVRALDERWQPTGELTTLVALSRGGALRDPQADAVVQAGAWVLRWWFERDAQDETSTAAWSEFRKAAAGLRAAGAWETEALGALGVCFAVHKRGGGRLAQRLLLRELDDTIAALQAAGEASLAEALRGCRARAAAATGR